MLSFKLAKKVAIFAIFWLFCCKNSDSMAQKSSKITLKELLEYEKSLKTYYLKLWHAQREEFKDLNEKGFMYYLPSVGLQFGLPSVQFTTRDYTNLKRDKKLLKSKLQSLDEGLELEMNERLQALRVEFSKIRLEYDKMAVTQGKMKFLRSLHEIKLECCRRRECTPEDCRKAELEMYSFEELQNIAELNIAIMILEFEKLSKFGLPNEHFTH